MSITDELREWWVRKFPIMDKELHKDFTAIADRIDMEHGRLMEERADRYSELRTTMKERYVELPKDADDVPICIGDVMELTRLSNKPSFEVRAMRYDEGGWEVYDRLGDRYVPSVLRHYHAPTVEDVLREFTARLIERGELTNGAAQTIAEYAARLRLAGSDAE